MNGIHGKVALVTGGSQGIGEAVVRAFVREGAKVVIADILDEIGEALAAEIRAGGGEAVYVHANVTKEEDVKGMVDAALKAFGRLDFGINNAGIGGASAPAGEYTLENWNRVIDVNLTGVFLSLRHEIPEMLKVGGGVVINISSILGWVGFANSAAYVAAKHGVLGLTKSAAMEYATQNIRVLAVSPAFIETPLLTNAGMAPGSDMYNYIAGLHPMKRLGKPEEISELVVFLCSDGASFMTGNAVLADGGYVAQ